MTQPEQLQQQTVTTVADIQDTSEYIQTRPFAPVAKHTSSSAQGIQPKANSSSGFGHSFGNLAVFPPTRSVIQPKLTIGQPGDKYEQEADRVAADVVQRINQPQVVSPKQQGTVQRQELPQEEELQMKPLADSIQRMEAPDEEELQMKPLTDSIQRMEAPEEEELQMKPLVQRREATDKEQASTDLESSINSARGGGQLLDSGLQQSMGQAMGADFSGVKIHTDAQADQLNKSIQAKAFTTGQDVFFRQGAYEPQSRGGQELIAHELTHVVQQTGTIAEEIQRDVDVNSLATAKKKANSGDILVTVAEQFGYNGDFSNIQKMRDHIKDTMGFQDDHEVDELLDEQAKDKNLYEEVASSQDQTNKLTNLQIPTNNLDTGLANLKQDTDSGACQAAASIAGLLIQDASKLESVLQDGSQPDFATFKFPPADALAPYAAHSSDETKQSIQNITQAQNNVYKVPKKVYKGDLLPSTEPWVNLLLQAAHQHILAAGYGSSDSYNVHVPLSVKETANDDPKDITFNLLTAEIGEPKTGETVATKLSDDELKGKKLQIGYKGHARVLVVKQDGSKIYYDNQNGVPEVVNTSVKEFLEKNGFNEADTEIKIEQST